MKFGSGCECVVYEHGRTRVAKYYPNREARDLAYFMQRRLHRHRLAPAVFRRGKNDDDEFAYYYISSRAICGEFTRESKIELGQKIFDLGYVLTDPHDGNIGYMFGRAVVIDCGDCSFRRVRKKDKSYLHWWKREQDRDEAVRQQAIAAAHA